MGYIDCYFDRIIKLYNFYFYWFLRDFLYFFFIIYVYKIFLVFIKDVKYGWMKFDICN